MGNSSKVSGEVMQKLLDEKSKEVDRLNLKIDIYQRLMLDQLQDPSVMGNIISNFTNRYNNFSKDMTIDFNNTMNNPEYISQENRVSIINIIFRFDSEKINVVAPTNFKLKNIFNTANYEIE